MHSVPPTGTTSFSPAAIVNSERQRLSEDAQALLTVKPAPRREHPPDETWRGVRASAGLTGVAEDRLVHGGGRKSRPFQGRFRRDLAQIRGRECGERSSELADRRAGGGEDEDGTHENRGL
jgi:hypothetical protein